MELWHFIVIYVVVSVGVRFAIKAYQSDESEAAREHAHDTNRNGLLSDPAKMLERSLVFMAGLDARPKLYGLNDRAASYFATSNTETVDKTGAFAKGAFDLEHLDAPAFRQLLLTSLLNTQYRPASFQGSPDTTMANICFGLAVLSQNTLFEETEVAGWRLLLLSKAKEVYPTYDTAYAALNRYYQAVLNGLKAVQTQDPSPQAPSDYRLEQEKRAQEAGKKAARLDKHLLSLHKLNGDAVWYRHMQQSWDKFQPMMFEEITRIERSHS